jgi:hypothetical protein
MKAGRATNMIKPAQKITPKDDFVSDSQTSLGKAADDADCLLILQNPRLMLRKASVEFQVLYKAFKNATRSLFSCNDRTIWSCRDVNNGHR